MAIKISGTTIIDDSRNIINVGFSGTANVANASVRRTAVTVAALDINCSTGNYFTKSISASSAFTFSSVPTTGNAYAFVLRLTITTGGSASFPASVVWSGGTAPTLSVGKTYLFYFATDDGGANWRGSSTEYAS